jgi:hypothetical protein
MTLVLSRDVAAAPDAVLAGRSSRSDGIVSDGASLELSTMTGNVTDGFVASPTVAV